MNDAGYSPFLPSNPNAVHQPRSGFRLVLVNHTNHLESQIDGRSSAMDW